MRIQHKFRDHTIQPDTKILLVGTFNPDIKGNCASIFYGREMNDLWDLLPTTFGVDSLKNATLALKWDFCYKQKIDFVDMIEELDNVPKTELLNYEDEYIDGKATNWKDVTGLIQASPSIKEVYFTRKTFNSKIPGIRNKAKAIKDHCLQVNIRCAGLITPSRMYRNMSHKRDQWHKTLVAKTLTEFTGI